MTKKCLICESINDDAMMFCESCGSPLEKNQDEEQKGLGMRVGYMSSLREHEKKDTFLVMDTTALFGEDKQRRIFCVIVKGLTEHIDGRVLTYDLTEEVLRNKGEIEYSPHLLEIQNKLKTDFAHVFSNRTKEESKKGLLVGVIDNTQVNALYVNAPKVFVLKHNTEEIIKSNQDEEFLSVKLENNDRVCMSCSNLFDFIEETELQEIISEEKNPQAVCEALVSKMKTENPDVDFSLMLTQIRD